MLEVGRIAKPHGVRGEVVVDPITNIPERRFYAGARFAVQGRDLEITAARPYQQRWLVRFAGVDDRFAADALRGVVLLAEPLPDDDADALWVHELIGATVVTVGGVTAGTVEAVQANPASDLLVLDTGALVPLVFVVGHEAGVVTIDPPEGLLEL